MAEVKLTISDELMKIIQQLAEIEGTTPEDALQDLLKQSLAEFEARLNDPVVGMIGIGDEGGDVSERVEEILYQDWMPD